MKKKVLLVCPWFSIVLISVIALDLIVTIIMQSTISLTLSALILILFPAIIGVSYSRKIPNAKSDKQREWVGTKIFDIVILSEEGIRNSRRKISWDKVVLVKAKTYEYGRHKADRAMQQVFHTMKDIELACFYAGREVNGKVYADADTEIVLHMNKKTRRLLLKYAEGRSQIVDKFLNSAVDWYKYMD